MATTVSEPQDLLFVPLYTLQPTTDGQAPDEELIETVFQRFQEVVLAGALQKPISPKDRDFIAYVCSYKSKNSEQRGQKIVLSHSCEALKKCSTLAMVQEFCASPEGEESLKAREDLFLNSLYEQIRAILGRNAVLERHEALFSCVKKYLRNDEIEWYNSEALSCLESHFFCSGSGFPLQATIERLQSEGFTLPPVDTFVVQHLEDLGKNWLKSAEESGHQFSSTDMDTLTVEIDNALVQLQKQMEEETREVTGASTSNTVKEFLSRRAAALQGQAILSFTAKASQATIDLICTKKFSKEEYAGVLSMIEKLHVDIETLKKSPVLEEVTTLNDYSSQLKAASDRIKKEIEDCSVHPEHHLSPEQKLMATMVKVVKAVGRIFSWLPFILQYVFPIAFSTRAGYLADGTRGALFCGGVATATSILATFSSSIAQKASEQVLAIHGIPERLRSPASSLIRLSLRMICIVIAMQANGMIAGVAGSLAASKATASSSQSLWYPKRVWNSFWKFLDSGGEALSDSRSYLNQEGALATSALNIRQDIPQYLGTLAHNQIQAIVAGYHLGQASVDLPVSFINLVKTAVGY